MQSAHKPAATRPARAAGRYWKGKAPKGADAALSDSDSDAGPEDVREDEEEIGEEEFELAGKDDEEKPSIKKGMAKMSVALRDVEVKDGKVYVGGEVEEEEEEESEEEDTKPNAPGESGSSEYESSSEEESEEEPPKPQFRPVFVPKRARETIKKLEAESEFSEEAIKKREEEAAQRKKESHDMVAESIKRELVEKETAENIPDVDDTDGLDPAAEFEAWRARELTRISRDAQAAQAREEERLERERRAALPEEVRLREDMERAEKSRAGKPQGQQKFLQKYWHKGAFHQDAEILKRHDFTEATESTVDATSLPAVMQVKNFGKRGQTKYTHLRDQDTTVKLGEFGAVGLGKAPRPAGAVGVQEGCFNCGGPHLKRAFQIVLTHLNQPAPTHRLAPATLRLLRLGELADPRTLPTTGAKPVQAGRTATTLVTETMTDVGMSQEGLDLAGTTGTETGTGGPLTDETGRPTAHDTMTIEDAITHHAGEMTMEGTGATGMRMTGADAPALVSTAANDRRLATKTGRTRGDE